MGFNQNEILETVHMIDSQNLDVRTVTMALSLLDCAGGNADETAERMYKKIVSRAGKLVAVADELGTQYGVPIVNKRVSVTPISLVGARCGKFEVLCEALDKAAKHVGIDFIGGYSALVHKGTTDYEAAFIESIPAAIAATDKVCASVNVGTTRSGINMDAVAQMGHVIKALAARTADADGAGCAKLVVFCNAVEDNPFMAGAFTGVGEGDAVINVGVSGPGTVYAALQKLGRGADLTAVAEEIKRTSFKITRVGQLIASRAAQALGATCGIVDLSLAPTPKVGDSVAQILEEIGLQSVGAPGTTACLALLNDAVKKGGVMASCSVGGLSGAFIPVSEDAGMIEAVQRGALTLEKLEAMTCVCSVGLDMIAVPGETSAETLSGILADECAIGMINNKTTAVRVIPVPGKGVGESVNFGGLLGHAPIMPVSGYSPADFIGRGGRIPAPLHSLKN